MAFFGILGRAESIVPTNVSEDSDPLKYLLNHCFENFWGRG
jgi:hypothetical protein